MHCEHSLERGKRNPKRLAGVPANEKPKPGCSCIAADQWRPGRSQQGRALVQRVVVVSEQQNPEGSSHTAEREGKDFGKKGMNHWAVCVAKCRALLLSTRV